MSRALLPLLLFLSLLYREASSSELPSTTAKAACFTVDPKCWCQDTGIRIVKGRDYLLTATGCTVDWFVPCDASGPRCPLARLLMCPLKPGLRVKPCRAPKAHFLTLIGSLECAGDGRRPKDAFVIGKSLVWNAPSSGTLHVFVNDWRRMYGNNKGCLHLQVEPVPPQRTK